MKIIYKFIFMVGFLLFTSCQGGEPGSYVEVKDAWVRSVDVSTIESSTENQNSMDSHNNRTGVNTAAYMKLVNLGGEPDTLVRIESDSADTAEFHKSEMIGDVVQMRSQDHILVPGQSTVELTPGGLHIMLIGLDQSLKLGDTIELLLEFEKFGKLTVEAEIRNP